MIATLTATVAFAAAPHVVILQRSGPTAPAGPVLAELRKKLDATDVAPCPRGVDCLTERAYAQGVDVAVGMSIATGRLGTTVDLEAMDHYGRTVATWTGTLPIVAPDFFAAVLKVEPFPTIPTAPPPPSGSLKPSTVFFISAAILAAGSLATGVSSEVIDGPLHSKLQMKPVIPGTRDTAQQQVNQVNGLVTACLILGLTAAGVALAGVISLLF
jgi:hypothetical protein